MEGPPVTFTVPLVLILVPTGVGRQQSTQQSQAEERLRGGDWLGGGESIHQETEAACQHHDLQHHQVIIVIVIVIVIVIMLGITFHQ